MSKNIYMDYSATTMADRDVIDFFCEVARKSYANSNSNHLIGAEAKSIIDDSINIISKYFNVSSDEVIFTSGASESNNMVFKGLSEVSSKKHIITTPLEHSSIYGPISYLQKKGYEVSFVNILRDGTVDINELESLIREDTLIVSICAVDSETGIKEPIEEIAEMLKNYDVYFHVDATQAIGKVDINYENVDLLSFSGHKIYAFKGIGALIKKGNVKLMPLIHGGKSTTVYRSGTPQTELIASIGKAFSLFDNSLDEKYSYVANLNKKIREHIGGYDSILVNSTDKSIPHILNISFIGKNANETQSFFANKGIYISTKTACASNNDMSKTVYALTGRKDAAESSVRISLSYKTKMEEVDILLRVIDEYMRCSNENN